MAALSVLIVSRAESQALHPLPCPPEEATAFNFLIGQWQGQRYELKGTDSTLSGVTAIDTATKVLHGCALEEHWRFSETGTPQYDIGILRAFDVASKTWHYAGFSNENDYFTLDGRRDGAVWRFYFAGTSDDKLAHTRISWVGMPWGYSEQIARSTDGTTWVDTRHWNFKRLKT
jgi:hypothetical protein